MQTPPSSESNNCHKIPTNLMKSWKIVTETQCITQPSVPSLCTFKEQREGCCKRASKQVFLTFPLVCLNNLPLLGNIISVFLLLCCCLFCAYTVSSVLVLLIYNCFSFPCLKKWTCVVMVCEKSHLCWAWDTAFMPESNLMPSWHTLYSMRVRG